MFKIFSKYRLIAAIAKKLAGNLPLPLALALMDDGKLSSKEIKTLVTVCLNSVIQALAEMDGNVKEGEELSKMEVEMY